jgi:hypothetical protein
VIAVTLCRSRGTRVLGLWLMRHACREGTLVAPLDVWFDEPPGWHQFALSQDLQELVVVPLPGQGEIHRQRALLTR